MKTRKIPKTLKIILCIIIPVGLGLSVDFLTEGVLPKEPRPAEQTAYQAFAVISAVIVTHLVTYKTLNRK